MARPSKYSPELRERAVRMVFDHAGEHPSQWATIRSVGEELGCSMEALRRWVRQAERDAGALAIAVALVGLGGLLARAVSERRRELAIRTVLGASPGEVVGIIVREGFLLAAAGVILGLGAGAGAARWLRSLLYGVSSLDAVTFGGVAVFVTAAALLTSLLAARRAARIAPLELLRS